MMHLVSSLRPGLLSIVQQFISVFVCKAQRMARPAVIQLWFSNVLLFIAAAVLTSCEMDLRELCYDHTHDEGTLRVRFLWDAASSTEAGREEANRSRTAAITRRAQQLRLEAAARGEIYGDGTGEGENGSTRGLATGDATRGITVRVETPQPSAMRLAPWAMGFTGVPSERVYVGRDGGELWLRAGLWQLIGYNSDAADVFQRGTSWATFEMYSNGAPLRTMAQMFAGRRAIPVARGTEEQPIIYEPGELWTSASAEEEVVLNQSREIAMPMQDATSLLTIVIDSVENLPYISECVATVSGMAGSWSPTQGRCSDTECIIPFNMHRVEDVLFGDVRNFGHCPNALNTHEHLLVIYVGMADGRRIYYTFDITVAMHDVSPVGFGWPLNVEIDLRGLPVPQPVNESGGMDPTVGEWEEEEVIPSLQHWN